MKCPEERNHVLAFGVIACEFERTLNRLCSGVAVVHAMRTRHGRNFRKPFSQCDQALVIKICARHMNEFAGLLLDGGDYLRMAVSGRSHGNSGREIEELVSIYIGYNNAASLFGH